MMKIPLLASLRLTLWPYQEEDFSAFALLNADPSVRRHVGGPLSREGAARLFERFIRDDCEPGNEVWAVVDRSSGHYIGHCWFVQKETDCPEMGFLVATRFWRQGYGTEVAQTLLDYARRGRRYRRIIATVDCDHIASILILERIGMKREGKEHDGDGEYYAYSIDLRRGPTP